MKSKDNVCDLIIFIVLICLTNTHYALSQCNDSQWKCDNGECISDEVKCNGKVDCRDRSDEIAENCMQFSATCPSYAFNCLYGACIAKKLTCNGQQDCADNSDEFVCSKNNELNVQGRCSEDEMQCKDSKECISTDFICDGRKHCSDGSDETAELCIRYTCVSAVGFQCGYGACINGNAKCNGVIECADGSDEAWELCNYPRKENSGVTPTSPTRPTRPRPTTPSQCQIPNTQQKQNLVFKLHPFNDTVQPGSFIEDFETIHVECSNGLSLRGPSDLFCREGGWNYNFPSCLNQCDSSLISGLSTRAICDPNYNFGPCKNNIPPNTEIQINCAPGYTNSLNGPQFVKCLPNGTFDKKREACVQNCGRVASSADGLSRGGVPIKPSSAPWHAAIYEDNSVEYQYFCSGSIISPRIVISAAHCFWDEANVLQKNSKFQIIAGKNNRNYTKSSDDSSQIIDVEKIHIPKEYKGRRSVGGGHLNDIAIIKLKTPLQYNENILSICVPREFKNTALNYVNSGLQGFITGYGINNQLERLNMLTLSYHACLEKSPTDTPIAVDKFCIYTNDGASVCRGDSGGGYVREISQDTPNGSTKIYNLLGIISNTPHTRNDCTREDSDAYVAVTSIHYMTPEFINILHSALEEDKIMF